MSNRYLVQINIPTMVTVAVVADSFQEAKERALQGEGSPQEQWTEEAHIKAITRLEEG
jgi:hypothetical protein